MTYTETSSVSWFDRIKSSFKGIITGLILFVVGTVILWLNEGNFVATRDALNEAEGVTEELVDITKVDYSKNAKLVHAMGDLKTDDIISDPVFGISLNAIRLERKVEYYQWTEESSSETRQKLGGGEETVTTYSYVKKWVDSPVISSGFRDPAAHQRNKNFILADFEDFKVQARNVFFGAYRMPEFFISSVSGAIPLELNISDEVRANLNKQVRSNLPPQQLNTSYSGGFIQEEIPVQEAFSEMVHVNHNVLILSPSPGVPQIGDVRISFSETKPAFVSILAKLNNDSFEPYRAKNGKQVSKLSMGSHSLEAMYDDAHSSNTIFTWILRLVGTALIISGLKMVFAPLVVLASVIPLLGNIMGAGTGIVSFLLGLAWSILIIAIAWLRFRPVIGVVMLLVVAALIYTLFMKGKKKKIAVPESTDTAS